MFFWTTYNLGHAGEGDYLKTCAWTSDMERVVLEMPNESGKGTKDSEVSTIRELLHEMEEEEVIDVTLNGHQCSRAPACGDGSAKADSHSLRILLRLAMICTSVSIFQVLALAQVQISLWLSRSRHQYTSSGPLRH